MSIEDGHYLTEKDLEVLKMLKDVDKEAWQDYAIELLIELHTKGDQPPPPKCPDGQCKDPVTGQCRDIKTGETVDSQTNECIPPPPPPTCDEYETFDPVAKKCIPPKLPDDGREQFHKGASRDTSTWRVVNMLDDPSLFKIVDNANVNVADEFHTKENAEQFITYYKWLALKQGKCKEQGKEFDPVKNECIEPPPTCPEGQVWDPVQEKCVDIPPPTGDVKMIYTPTGKEAEFKFKSSNSGRAQWVAATGECYVNQEVTGYLFINEVDNMGEEVSMKLRGGPHTDRDNNLGCCYIIGIEYGGKVNSQIECPHPNNSGMSSKVITPNILGNNITKKWFGIKGIVYLEGDHDKIECWIDPDGLIDGKPANNWKKFWETTSTKFTGKCNGKNENMAYFRLDDIPGGEDGDNVELKFASCREIKVHGGPEPCPPQTCPQGQHWDSQQCKCVDDNPQPTGDFPYAAIGSPMQTTQRGPTVRHYNSGKPDDNTIEKNCKNIKFKNYQFVADITNDCDWAHDDTFSMKLGGRHMSEGWLDNGLGVYSGECCLGTEKRHPSTQLCVIRGPKIGDTRGKRFKLACTYFTDQNKTELWTNFGSGWIKQMEGTNVNNFNPNSPEDETQLRIDGFKERNDPPTIHSAVVTEIAPSAVSGISAASTVSGKGKWKDCSDDLD